MVFMIIFGEKEKERTAAARIYCSRASMPTTIAPREIYRLTNILR
jgi:hypothetical protein